MSGNGPLKGHSGPLPIRLAKAEGSLEKAVMLSKRLRGDIEGRRGQGHQIRAEGIKLVVKNALITLESVAAELWADESMVFPRGRSRE